MWSNSRANLGPLTTTWTPPSSCSVLGIGTDNPTLAWQAQQCYTTSAVSGTTVSFTDNSGNPTTLTVPATTKSNIYYDGVADDFTCRPPTSYGVPAPSIPLNGWGFYSPGVVCPSGYTSTCTATVGPDGSPAPVASGNSFQFQFALQPGETAVGCCPKGYFCTGTYQTCLSFATNEVLTVTKCVDGTSTVTSTLSVPNPAASTVQLYAPLVQLVWQSSDIKPTVTVTQHAENANSHGLDTGDQAAIGVGVVAAVGFVAIAILACLLLRRRRRVRTTYPNHSAPNEWKEAEGTAESEATPLAELGSERAELPGHSKSGRRELGA